MSNFTTDGKICIERELEPAHIAIDFEHLVSRFDISATCNWIRTNGFLKVCLQFPDDMLPASAQIYKEIKDRVDVDLYILGDTSYASCCVDSVAAMHVAADAIVHYGHSCFSKANIPVFTVLGKRDLDVDGVMTKLQHHFKEETEMCLFYDTEYEHCKGELSKCWFEKYPHSFVACIELGESPNKFLGRVVRDAVGEEHAVGRIKDSLCVYVGTRGQTMFNYSVSIPAKAWYVCDPCTLVVERAQSAAWARRRRFLVEACRDARALAALVGAPAASARPALARLKALCKANGKKCYVVAVGKPNVAKLANFPEIDIYVMIACPENELYSSRDFYKPIVYPFELEVALNSNREPYFTHHITDYEQLLPGGEHHCDIQPVKETTDVSLITGKIRETKVNSAGDSMDLVEKQNWALENIGHNLEGRSWRGLEQKLGETEVGQAGEGRAGIPSQYTHEPE